MKKTLFVGLLLLLVVSLTGMTSCAKSALTSTAAPSSSIAAQTTTVSAPTIPNSTSTTPSSNAGSLPSSASAAFDWSTIPIYPGSARNSHGEIGEPQSYRVYTTTDNSDMPTILNWYKSELSKNGWTIPIFNTNYLQDLEAKNANYDIMVMLVKDGDYWDIRISFQ